jgi:hypothetical protein
MSVGGAPTIFKMPPSLPANQITATAQQRMMELQRVDGASKR